MHCFDLVRLKVVFDALQRSTSDAMAVAEAVAVQIYFIDAVVVKDQRGQTDGLVTSFWSFDAFVYLY